mmetsp:Transcript_15828/g.23803  ORF Transcript_15828/g.23803 Transcript_15828/m.23803 type:complete len:356 (-) Transcript_15828:252-1319(-)
MTSSTKAQPMDKDKTNKNQSQQQQQHRPWYRSGGMKVNMVGMGVNIATPLIVMARNLDETSLKSFITVLLFSWAASLFRRKTLYCIVVVPTFMTSLLLCTSLDNIQPQVALSIATAIAICKVNICMSVCLHRYAAHSAFKCGYFTNIFLAVLGCLANQGGPIWWASQHRCHHKHCDVKRDPHSPILDGTELAFSFFEVHDEVEEEFVPNHLDCDSLLMRVLDTWSWVVVFCELYLSYVIFGMDGLFISYTSGWLCQSITLWFNVVNHPPEKSNDVDHAKKACKATDGKDTSFEDFYIPFMFLDALIPLFAFYVKEAEHEHHHNNARLAKRSKFDVGYWGFVWPLEQLGLVWNVIV